MTLQFSWLCAWALPPGLRALDQQEVSDELARAERSLGVRLPDDYRWFLEHISRGSPVALRRAAEFPCAEGTWVALSRVLGIHPDARAHDRVVDHTLTCRDDGRISQGSLTIAADPGGNMVLMSVAPGEVGRITFHDHDHTAPGADGWLVHDVAPTFSAFLDSLQLLDAKVSAPWRLGSVAPPLPPLSVPTSVKAVRSRKRSTKKDATRPKKKR